MARHENETTEMWREFNDAQREQALIDLPIRTKEITDLESQGFTIRRITAYQFRVDERLDLYPRHRRFHDLRTGNRGHYGTALAVALRIIRSACKDCGAPGSRSVRVCERRGGWVTHVLCSPCVVKRRQQGDQVHDPVGDRERSKVLPAQAEPDVDEVPI